MPRFGLFLRAALFFLSNQKRTSGLYNSRVALCKILTRSNFTNGDACGKFVTRFRISRHEVTLKPDLVEELAARAQAEGLTTEQFVNRALEKLVANEPSEQKLTPHERAKLLREWIDNHSVDGPPLADYAVGRESFYNEREDAQL